jgi:hypothetical protein
MRSAVGALGSGEDVSGVVLEVVARGFDLSGGVEVDRSAGGFRRGIVGLVKCLQLVEGAEARGWIVKSVSGIGSDVDKGLLVGHLLGLTSDVRWPSLEGGGGWDGEGFG